MAGTALCLILLALLGFTAQAQADVEQFVIPVGAVGSSPPDPNPWVIASSYPDTTTCVLVWEDNKQLESGPGALSFFIDGDSGSPYTGHLLDAGLNAIPGTAFFGIVNVDAVKIDLTESTRFSGLRFEPCRSIDSSSYVGLWLSFPTVVEGEAGGNQPPIANAGDPYQLTAGVGATLSGIRSDDPDGFIVQYDWDYGDNNTALDAGPEPTHTWAEAGTYNVTLTVTDDNGARGSDKTTANVGAVNAPPVADAGPPGEGSGGTYLGTVDVPMQLDGSDSSDDVGITSYNWEFGSDSSSPDDNVVAPQVTYSRPGERSINLRVEDGQGESDTTYASTVDIKAGDQPPKAEAGPPVTGTVGEPVTFDGSASNDPDDEITAYTWDFGDGQIATGEIVEHTYNIAREWTATLVVASESGNVWDTTTASIAEADANASPTADPGGPYTGEAGVAVSFDGSGSSDDGSIVSYAWEFGDGNNGTGVTVDHTYATADNYLVTLTVTDDEDATGVATTSAAIGTDNQAPTAEAGGPYPGTVNVPVQFTGINSSDPDPGGEVVAYAWAFGDEAGGTSDRANPTYSYAAPGIYEVTLTVTDNENSRGQDRTIVIVGDGNEPPVADANGPYRGTVGEAVTFDGSASTDHDGEIVTWTWFFGDGRQTGAGETVEYTYATAAPYHVVLLVTDDDGSSRAALTSASIGTASQPPIADPGGPYPAQLDASVTFDGSASSDPDGFIVQYDWDFGDGSDVRIDGGPNPSYTYTAVGDYPVTLTVTDDAGEQSPGFTTVTVAVGNVPPQADAGPSEFAQTGTTITFDGSASRDPEGPIARYDWVFGDGDSASNAGPNPEHVYETEGSYKVTLTVTDADGAPASDVTQATVSDPSLVFSSILPLSRSVQVGTLTTIYGAMVNGGTSAASQCGIALQTAIDADFLYQTVDPSGVLVGVANTPADIPVGGAQNYAIAFVPRSAFGPVDVELAFDCVNTEPAAITPGLNTLLLSSSAVAVPDIIALAATPTNDGVLYIPESNVNAFAVASINVGAAADITVVPDAGDLPLVVTVCETDPATGACINPSTPAGSATVTMPASSTNTFSVFVTATDDVPFDPGNSRIEVRFEDADGTVRGSTSVAVTTDTN
jgi:PKD repeat protein